MVCIFKKLQPLAGEMIKNINLTGNTIRQNSAKFNQIAEQRGGQWIITDLPGAQRTH